MLYCIGIINYNYREDEDYFPALYLASDRNSCH